MLGRLEQSIRFGRVGMMKLRPDDVAKAGLKRLGRGPSAVVGGQYKLFAMLTKRVLSRATGAWLFGTLIRIAIGDEKLLDPNLNLAAPTGMEASLIESSVARDENKQFALARRK